MLLYPKCDWNAVCINDKILTLVHKDSGWFLAFYPSCKSKDFSVPVHLATNALCCCEHKAHVFPAPGKSCALVPCPSTCALGVTTVPSWMSLLQVFELRFMDERLQRFYFNSLIRACVIFSKALQVP